MSNQLDQIWGQLITEMSAVTELTDLLGATDAIYWAKNRASLPFPHIMMSSRDNPQNNGGTITTLWRPDLQIDVFGKDPHVLTRINTQIGISFDIPRNRNALIQSTNFQITMMRNVNSYYIGTVRLAENGEMIHHAVSEWRLRVNLRTT